MSHLGKDLIGNYDRSRNAGERDGPDERCLREARTVLQRLPRLQEETRELYTQ